MRSLTWDDYYEKYYDLAESTRANYLSFLSDIGSSDEVAEIITDLSMDNESNANRLLRKAVETKVIFAADDLYNFAVFADEKLLNESAINSSLNFTSEDLNALSDLLDDETILTICKERKLPLPEGFEYLRDDEDCETSFDEFPEDDFIDEEKPKKAGFFKSLLMAISGVSIFYYLKDKLFDDNDN